MNPEEKKLIIDFLATDSIIREIEDTEMYPNATNITLNELRTHAHEVIDQLATLTDIMDLTDTRKEELVQKYRLR